MTKRSRNLALLLGLSTALYAPLALAVPTSVDPAKVEQRFGTGAPQPASPNVQVAPIPGQGGLSAKETQALAAQRFTLKDVVVKGSTVYSKDQLRGLYADMIGKNISMLDARGIARKVTERYRDDRYVLSYAKLPPVQSNGVLTIQVVEGYVSQVQVQGAENDASRNAVASYANALKAQKPVRLSDIERYLLLMSDVPGTTAKGFLQPSKSGKGEADMSVTLTHKRYGANLSLDNRGSKYIGPMQYSAEFVANSLITGYDRTSVRAITTSPTTELRYFDLNHDELVGGSGLRVGGQVSHSRTNPGDSLKNPSIVANSYFGQLRATYPILRSRQDNVNARVMFDARNTATDQAGQQLSEDHIRALRAGGNYSFFDRFRGTNLFDMQVSQGVDVFGATDKSNAQSRTRTDNDFTKLNLDASRIQSLPYNLSFLTAASGQVSRSRLLPAEQFSIGGPGFGEAYDPSELSGDSGVAGKAELRYSRAASLKYLSAYQVFGFYDIGRVWLRGSNNDNTSLASAGLGVRANFTPVFSGYVQTAMPLTKPVANQGGHDEDPRFFFGLSGRF